jgi:hypothetical protein
MKKTETDKTPTDQPELSRRKALAGLGFGAAAVYSAPVILHPDRSANAGIVPTPGPPKHDRQGPYHRAWWRP